MAFEIIKLTYLPKSREWTTWHEEARMDNAGVSDSEKMTIRTV